MKHRRAGKHVPSKMALHKLGEILKNGLQFDKYFSSFSACDVNSDQVRSSSPYFKSMLKVQCRTTKGTAVFVETQTVVINQSNPFHANTPTKFLAYKGLPDAPHRDHSISAPPV